MKGLRVKGLGFPSTLNLQQQDSASRGIIAATPEGSLVVINEAASRSSIRMTYNNNFHHMY